MRVSTTPPRPASPVPRSAAYWALISLLSLAVGSLFGAVGLAGAKRRMASPRPQENADRYIVSSASQIRNAGKQYLYTTSSQRYDPVREERSSGGSSHSSSSYSGSYSGSSGSSHSGSGRNF